MYKKFTDNELIKRYKSGNGDAFNTLYDRYRNKVTIISRQYYLIGGDKDDLIQEGMLGLLKAVNTYDESKGASFSTFAFLCINSAIKTAITQARCKKNEALYASTDISTAEKIISIYDPEQQVIRDEERKELEKKINSNLSKLERNVLKPFLNGLSYQEISQVAGVSEKSVDNALQRIKGKLKTLLSK